MPAVVKPAGADEATSAGAALFVRYWYDELDRAYAVLDNTALKKLSEPRCRACQNYIADIASSARDKERFVGGNYTVTSAIAPALVDKATVVLVKYDSEALTVVDENGSKVKYFPADTAITSQVQVIRRGTSWRVRTLRDIF